MWSVGQQLFNTKTGSSATVQSVVEVYEGCFEVTIVCPLGSTASGLQEQHEQCGWSAVASPWPSTSGYSRMEDGGCLLCSGNGCETCGYTGGY